MEAPMKQDLKGMMVIKTESDGSEYYMSMSRGLWKKTTPGFSTYDRRFRKASKAEIEKYTGVKKPEPKVEIEIPDVIDVPEEAPVKIEIPDKPVEQMERKVALTFEDKLEQVSSMNEMDTFLINELDYEDIDRRMTLSNVKKLAKKLKNDKEK